VKARLVGWIALALGMLAVGFVVLLVGYGLIHGEAGGSTGWANELAYLAFMLSFSTVGALVASKRPGNPIGWLLLGSVLCYAVGGAGVTVAGPAVIVWAGAWAWGVGVKNSRMSGAWSSVRRATTARLCPANRPGSEAKVSMSANRPRRRRRFPRR